MANCRLQDFAYPSLIAALRDKALIAPGPRAPTPGAPFAYVTTARFMETFGLETLGDLPDLEALQDAGLVEDTKPIEARPPATRT